MRRRGRAGEGAVERGRSVGGWGGAGWASVDVEVMVRLLGLWCS